MMRVLLMVVVGLAMVACGCDSGLNAEQRGVVRGLIAAHDEVEVVPSSQIRYSRPEYLRLAAAIRELDELPRTDKVTELKVAAGLYSACLMLDGLNWKAYFDYESISRAEFDKSTEELRASSNKLGRLCRELLKR